MRSIIANVVTAHTDKTPDPSLSTYQPSEQITPTASGIAHSSADMPSYRRASAHLPTSSITYGGGYSSAFTTPQIPHYAQYTSQYTPQAFQAPIPTQASEEQERHRHLQDAMTQATAHSSILSSYHGSGDDGSDSEVAVPASF